MPFTLAGFYENVDPAAAFNALTALADPHLTISGNAIRVPLLNKIVAIAGMAESTVAPRMRLVAPSLRRRTNHMVAPLNIVAAAAVTPNSPHRMVDLREGPLNLIQNENLTCELLSNPAAAQDQSCLVWFSDGPITPIKADIFTVRATAAATLVAGAWTNGSITFDEDLPRGKYQVVGMRAESAGIVAARLVPVGNLWRPGVLGSLLVQNLEHPMFRNGGLGVFCEFEDIEPPTVDFLSISADTAEVVYLDLVQLSAA